MVAVVLLLGTLVVGPQAERPVRSPMLLSSPTSVSMLDEGRGELLSGRLGSAERRFQQLARQPDGAAAAYHHLATVSILRVLLFDRETDYEQFFERSDSLRDVLDQLERSQGRTYLSAETDFQRGLAWAKTGNYVRAAMASVSAYRALSGLAEDDDSFHEAYKTLGVVHATIGTLPRRYRRFLSVFGFETDIEVGLDQLERAARHSRFGRAESLAFMAILDSFAMPSRVDAAETLGELYLEFDNSPIFALVQVDALLRSRRVKEAGDLLAELRDTATPETVRIDYLTFYQAEVDFKNEAWDDSAEGYRHYRGLHKGTALMAVAALREGLALEMAGRRDEAVGALQDVDAARDFDSDEAAARAAQGLIASPMTESEKDLLRARCAHDRSDYARADTLLGKLEALVESDRAFTAEVAYRRGRVYDETGRDDLALGAYASAISDPGDPAAKWGPYSLYYVARIHEEAGRLDEARGVYQAVVDYRPSYDYRGTNEQRARFALRRLED